MTMTTLAAARQRPDDIPGARHALLSAEEERDLARRAAGGDRGARDLLISSNARLVIRIAGGFRGRGLDLEDLIQDGSLGLIRAVELFDPDRGVRFSTYSGHWIKQSIRRAIADRGRAIRLPAYLGARVRAWQLEAARLHSELGRPPEESEVAASLGIDRRRLAPIRAALAAPAAIAQQADDSPPGPGASDGRPPDSVDIAEQIARALARLDSLPAREATALRLRLGLGGGACEPATLGEVGRALGVTKERARQIERAGLARLRESLGVSFGGAGEPDPDPEPAIVLPPPPPPPSPAPAPPPSPPAWPDAPALSLLSAFAEIAAAGGRPTLVAMVAASGLSFARARSYRARLIRSGHWPPTREADRLAVLGAARSLAAAGLRPTLARVARALGRDWRTVGKHRRVLAAEGLWPAAPKAAGEDRS